jgi:hypothetical protein
MKGYDVKARVAGETHFYQFKIPRVMIRRTALECSPPSNLQPIFLRMYLMRRPHSEQHNLLVSLKGKRRNVFYVCPRLYEASSFRRGTIRQALSVLPPNDSHSFAICAARSCGFSVIALTAESEDPASS